MSLNTYDQLSNDRMRRMSGILSGSETKLAQNIPVSPNRIGGILSGSIISGGTMNISINSSQSSKISPTFIKATTVVRSTKRKHAIIESDSDEE